MYRWVWVKKRKREGWCAVGAGGGEEEKKAYLVQGETSGGARRRKKVQLRASSDCCVRMCEVLLRRVSGGAGEEGG